VTRIIRRLSLTIAWRRPAHGRHLAVALAAQQQPVHPWLQLREQRVLELAERR